MKTARINRVDHLYTGKGYAAEREIAKNEERLLLEMDWPNTELFLNNLFPEYVTTEQAK